MAKYDNYTYEQAMHGVQTCIALMISKGWNGATPKHLRVGIDSAMVTEEAVATLLISKGLITKEEYVEAVRQAAIRELQRSSEALKQLYGVEITLG